MKRFSVGQFVFIGLLFWGLPAVLVLGPRAIALVAATAVPVWCLTRKSETVARQAKPLSVLTCGVLIVFALTFLLLDAVVGRKLLAWNMFLFGRHAINTAVEQTNSHVSQGRSLLELFGAIAIPLPFALIDGSRRAARLGRWARCMA